MTDRATGAASVRAVQAADPAATAAELAGQVGGELAADLAAAEALVRARVEAARRAVAAPAELADDGAVLGRADDIRAAAATTPPLADGDVQELRHLAEDLLRANRIRERTEARFTDALQQRVAASTGVAIHPAAVSAAAKAVRDAEQALEAARAAIVTLGTAPEVRRTVAAPKDDPVLVRPHEVFDEVALDRDRSIRVAVSTFVGIVGIGSIVAGFGVVPMWGIGVAAALGLLLALGQLRRSRARAEGHGDVQVASHLASVGAAVDSTSLGMDAAAFDRDSWADSRAPLDSALDAADEELRVARTRWHQVAGADADPHQADDVIRANDPQLAFSERLAESSPTVRTVAAFQRRAQARWKVLWAALGRDDTPEPEDLEPILDGLLAEHRWRQADLQRLQTAEARQAATVVAATPIVLVDPQNWLSPGRLAQLLSSLPPSCEVTLVQRADDP